MFKEFTVYDDYNSAKDNHEAALDVHFVNFAPCGWDWERAYIVTFILVCS